MASRVPVVYEVNPHSGNPRVLVPGTLADANAEGTAQVVASVVVPRESGNGIRTDPLDPAFGWHDLLGDISPKGNPPNAPTLAVFHSLYKAWFFGAGDEAYCLFHIPHDYVKGTDVFLHLHWSHQGTNISGNLVVQYGVTYSQGHGQDVFPAEVNPVLSVATPSTVAFPQYIHRLEEIQLSTPGGSATQIDTDLLEPDGLILVGLQVTTVPTITGGATNLPAFLTLDLHYQSTGVGTKQRAPDFYSA